MDREEKPPPSHLERLSVELLGMILSALPDAATFHSAVLSCPAFYFAFQGAQSSISTQFLLGQVGINTDLLPDAIAALESWFLSHRLAQTGITAGRREILQFTETHIHRRPDPPKTWTLRTTYRVGKLGACVSQLARKFASEAMAQPPLNSRGSAPPPTQRESNRIQRTLYRFEIYRNLFRDAARDAAHARTAVLAEQYELFFESFESWEIEQLGCIHDFLVRSVWPGEFSHLNFRY